MVIDIIKIVKALLSCLPFVLMCIVLTKLNLKKELRFKQVFLPVIALLYCIVAVIFLDKISTFVLEGIYWLIENVSWLGFLDKINWASGAVFVVNFALALGFALIKGIVFPILMIKSKFLPFVNWASAPFYYIAKEDEEWGETEQRYLRSSFGDAKKIISAMYYTMLAVFAILLVLTDFMISYEVFSSPFYPAFGMIVLGEIVAFLSGKTYEEKKESEDVPEPESESSEVDYAPIMTKYEEKFPNRIIKTSFTKPLRDVRESANDLLVKYKKEYEDDLCQEAGVMYEYYSDLEQSGKVLDEAYLRQTRNILDGKSVIFLTKFYTDTTDYVFLPVVRNLMRKKRVLVLTGNGGSIEGVKQWLSEGIAGVTGFERIWKIAPLADADDSTSVLLIDEKNIYNQKVLSEKSNLLADVSMVFILEANKLLGTLQMGLSCLVSYLRRGGNDPQYVIYDRNCDGLVDSLSHVLEKSLVQVNATSIGTAKKNAIFWKADGKHLHHKLGLQNARYLGMGTELALVALKEQVSKVVWASSRKFPVTDIGWIASQYYAALCKTAGLKISQNELSEHIEFVANPQSIPKTDNSFLIVEDEYNNVFEAARQFSTRGIDQSFVNVISGRYWLLEYMTDNVEIFKNDPKSIPTVTPDFQRSTGNMVYKMVMRMIEAPVPESEIRELLDILGEDTETVYKSLRELILKYCFRMEIGGKGGAHIAEKLDNALSVRQVTEVDPYTMRAERKRYYCIANAEFVDRFLSQLKIVYYIADEGNGKDNYLDSAMYGHVYQKYLPGMLITIDGKYYQIISMTKNSGIMLRRAADHITGRRYYRSLRRYTLTPGPEKTSASAKHSFGHVTLEYAEADIRVDTMGYLEMSEYCDIKNAKRVELSNIEAREYRSKEYLKVRMEGSTPEVRATIATFLNELFVTVFPETYQYITAATKIDGVIEGCLPELEGAEEECIYIIEDSLIDLGLLINVERYFVRFLEIICDVLNWHAEKLKDEEESSEIDDGEIEDEEPEEPEEPEDEGDDEGPKGIGGIIKGLFGRRKKKKKDEPSESADIGVIGRKEPDDSGIIGDDSEWITVIDGELEKADEEKHTYAETFFMLYGFDEVPEFLNLEETEKYLTEQGLAENYLKQARVRGRRKKTKWYNYVYEDGVHCCDFCGAVLDGKFDLLDDGRERCPECSRTAITKLRDFKKLYKKSRKRMEKVFGIKLKERINIKMCNAQALAEQLGETFSPTSGQDMRTLGFAYRYGSSIDIYIENGSPAVDTEMTLVHELTHIWQYANLVDIFNNRDPNAIEGMAVWAEIQYLVSIGMKERAESYMNARSYSDNEYGNGMKMYLKKYPIQDKPRVHRGTPFNCKRNPLR